MKTDNPFCGKSVAVTGKLDNYTRDGIKARLRELGARPVSKVSSRTDYLILGRRPGNKLVKALSLGIAVLSEQEFENMVSQSKAARRVTAPLPPYICSRRPPIRRPKEASSDKME